MSSGVFEIFRDSAGEYRFRLRAANGEIILKSEGYVTKSGAENGVRSVRANAPLDERFETRRAADGSPYFVLKAGNGEVVGVSEMYSSDAARDGGISSVQRVAPVARLKGEPQPP